MEVLRVKPGHNKPATCWHFAACQKHPLVLKHPFPASHPLFAGGVPNALLMRARLR